MHMRNFWLFLGWLAACAVTPALAQVNKWVDEKGRVQYGDQPPTGKAAVKPASTPKSSPAVNPNKPPPQPRLHVPGDPLVERLKESEARRDRERLSAKCWKEERGDCNESGMIHEMKAEEKKAAATAQKANVREPLSSDFCKRNPKVEACQPRK